MPLNEVFDAFDTLGIVPSVDCTKELVTNAAAIAVSQLKKHKDCIFSLRYEGRDNEYTIPKVRSAEALISQLIRDRRAFKYALTDPHSEYKSRWNPRAEDAKDPIPDLEESMAEIEENLMDLLFEYREELPTEREKSEALMAKLEAANRENEELRQQIEAFMQRELAAIEKNKSQIPSLERTKSKRLKSKKRKKTKSITMRKSRRIADKVQH